jgi:hypothetical protein
MAGRQAIVDLRVRRFRCRLPSCPRTTFVEQVPALADRYAHRTRRLLTLLQAIGLALGGRPGNRRCSRLAVPTSRTTLLHLVRALPDRPVVTSPRVLYAEGVVVLAELDPISVHAGPTERFVPEAAGILARLPQARSAGDVEQIIQEELRGWYGGRRLDRLNPERLARGTVEICHAWNMFLAASA